MIMCNGCGSACGLPWSNRTVLGPPMSTQLRGQARKSYTRPQTRRLSTRRKTCRSGGIYIFRQHCCIHHIHPAHDRPCTTGYRLAMYRDVRASRLGVRCGSYPRTECEGAPALRNSKTLQRGEGSIGADAESSAIVTDAWEEGLWKALINVVNSSIV